MSFDALAWAGKARPGSSTDKLVLFALADRHNTEHDAAWPSIKWVCDFTDLDRKAVIKSLDRLIEKGFIEDTCRRVGQTKQVKVYYLKIEQSPMRNSSQLPSEEYPIGYTDTIKEPVISPSEAKASSGGRRYVFEGKIIKLAKKDFEDWRETFHGIPDLKAELVSIDAWLQRQPVAKRQNWFNWVQSMLNTKHQERLAKKEETKRDPNFNERGSYIGPMYV